MTIVAHQTFHVENGASQEKKDKKKKRKRASDEDTPVDSEASSTKKEKKEKKPKTEEAAAEQAVASSSKTQSLVPPPSASDVGAFLTKHAITIHSPSPSTPILSFDQLDVPAGLRAACDGFTEPTPIQACSWPAALAGQDVVGIAETGR